MRAAVFDVRGRRVASLLDALLATGAHEVVWTGTDAHRRRAAPGVYFLRLEREGVAATRRVVLR